ncbi:hypothetical protein [Pseudomonas plecoglossicida]|nr:hypothetical protein [Pseudomonas plecoglossicida]
MAALKLGEHLAQAGLVQTSRHAHAGEGRQWLAVAGEDGALLG